jgi:hypothetical protein
MTALSNKDFKQGWIDSYYPYGQYMIQDNKMILSGDEIKVNNEILTQQIIKDSASGYEKSPALDQIGGAGSRNVRKKYKIKADSIKMAFQKLAGKVKGGRGDILILQLESLDKKNKIIFYKIYRKKI